MRTKLQKSSLAILVFIGFSFLVVSFGWRNLSSPMNLAQTGEWLEINQGASLSSVARELDDRNIIEFPSLFSIYARMRQEATRIQAGEYLIRPETTARELLEQLVSGQVYLHQITFVEGWTFSDVVTALQNNSAIDSNDFKSEMVMTDLGRPDLHPEGQFFPDTYSFPRNTKALEVLKQANTALNDRLQSSWANKTSESGLKNPYEALILASIIEKESKLASERKIISGVFHRRLELNMRLQADPTVIYGLGNEFEGDLNRENLTNDTPYNTYTRHGLPPTPISLVGQGSLSAAVDPEIGSALYFVATGNIDGSHYFSSTLEEHNKAVKRYLQIMEDAH
tara:strand:- start:354 stop:1370 length:1017 start_codon:yes stop_codon:yes gene_type:complete